jgi:3'(2'), 5'-bisphosphate nucleotidase
VNISDAELAVRVAAEAGAALLTVRAADPGTDAAALKDRGDQAAQEVIARLLATSRSDDAILSEEAPDDPARLSSSRVWIVDPLDGTREFSEPPRDDWAVHVALWAEGELVTGAVAIPARGVTHSAADPRIVPKRPKGPLRLAVSRSRPPAFVAELAAALGADLVPMGSAGVKAMAVVDGSADAYVHAGGQYEWDSAAPVAVARAHGLHTSRIDGSPLLYNRETPYLPDLVICRPELVGEIFAAIERLDLSS